MGGLMRWSVQSAVVGDRFRWFLEELRPAFLWGQMGVL